MNGDVLQFSSDLVSTYNAFQTKMWHNDLDKFRVNTSEHYENELFLR